MKRVLCAAGAVALLALPLSACGSDDDSSSDSAGSTASTDSTQTTAGEACDIDGRQRDLGASYVTSLEVNGLDCAEAEKIVRAYHACRLKDGPEGRCLTPVPGFNCTESDVQSAPGIQKNATATCENAATGATIVSAYTQNL